MDDNDFRDPDQEAMDPDEHSPYHKYPLKPTFWQRAKEKLSNNDNYLQREVIRKRRLKALGQSED